MLILNFKLIGKNILPLSNLATKHVGLSVKELYEIVVSQDARRKIFSFKITALIMYSVEDDIEILV